jgi:hypothetical protein
LSPANHPAIVASTLDGWPSLPDGDYPLRFRDSLAGGGVDEKSWTLDIEQFKQAPELILLIHGYNSNVKDFNKSAGVFGQRMAAACLPGRDWREGAPCVRVYWPGDRNWGWLSVLAYPLTVEPAENAAVQFAQALQAIATANPTIRIKMVIHSLGAHFVLRGLGPLQSSNQSSPKIDHMVLMAAAVPTWRLEQPPDDLHKGLLRALQGNRASSVYSAYDMVLTFAFPLGESVSGREGLLPTALGLQKWLPGPEGLGQEAARPTQTPNASYASPPRHIGHTNYWDGLGEDQLFDLLGVTQTLAKQTPLRSIFARSFEGVVSGDDRETLVRDTAMRVV